MITLTEAIEVPRAIEECFRYVADFRTTVEWDATATEAKKTTAGPVGLGSQFQLRCKAGPTSIAINYEITGYTPWQSLELMGSSSLFQIRDLITFDDLGDQRTRITYCAEFTYRWGLERLAKMGEAGLRKMGRASMAGLKRALMDDNPTPTPSGQNIKADQHLPSALACFTRHGYRKGRSRWAPMSTDMSGKRVLITGATTGLGFAAAQALLEAQADLTLVIRDPTKVESLSERLFQASGRRPEAIELADLSLLADVDTLCDRLLQYGKPIDVLINNAGALFNDHEETCEGFERSLALLLLSPWRLTERLHGLLAHHDHAARVINVVSGGMYTQKLRCDALHMTRDGYRGAVAYARAKRALTVLTEQWAERWRADNIVVNSMHPGWADTPGVQSALPLFRSITRTVLRSPEEGADTIVWLARAREADQVSGKLFLDREPRPTHLRAGTREEPEERAQLIPWLEQTVAHLDRAETA